MLNLHSSQNAGDAALLEMALQTLWSAFPSAQIMLAINDPQSTIFEFTDSVGVVPSFETHFRVTSRDRKARWRLLSMISTVGLSMLAALVYKQLRRVPTWLPSPLRELITAYIEADMLVSCPGNIFATMGRFGLPFAVASFIILYGLLLGKPLYVLPQSIGPLGRGWERLLIRKTYARARLIFVREPVSLRLAYQIGLPSQKIYLVPDLAFALPCGSLEQAARFLEGLGLRKEEPRIGVTAINKIFHQISLEEQNRYEAAMAYALSQFAKKHEGRVIFFPQVVGPTAQEDDRIAAKRIIARMDMRENTIIVEKKMSPSELKALYSFMDMFIATRLHSAIFAVSTGVPTLLIGYLHKTTGLGEMLGLEEWLIELKHISNSLLLEKVESLWQSRLEVRRYLEERLSSLVSQIAGVSTLIAQDFYGTGHWRKSP